MQHRARNRRRLMVLALALAMPAAIRAQTSYYNLDGSRPLRVEDVLPTERHALDVELAPLRYEHYPSGTQWLRLEPKLSYGVLPLTELEVRVPVVTIFPPRAAGARRTIGAAGVAVGALHAFGVETGRRPGLALGAEALIPAGPLSGPHVSYTAKLLATRTGTLGRLQLNAAWGTYSVRPAPLFVPTACTASCGGNNPPDLPLQPFDFPCAPPAASASIDRTMCAPARASALAGGARFDPRRSGGAHWVTAVGADHAFGLRSTLVSADVVAERFVGLYALTDWTAEAGMRRQLTPRAVIDFGIGRHFAGVVQSTSATLGLTWELTLPAPNGFRL